MSYIQKLRLDFIDWHLAVIGKIGRAIICEVFEVSPAVASRDLQLFISEHPGVIEYDKSKKCYLPVTRSYATIRKLDPRICQAISLLYEASQSGGIETTNRGEDAK